MTGSGAVETLAGVDVLDRVCLTVADERHRGVVDSRLVASDRLVVLASGDDGDRRFRVETRWASGWLTPLVDVLDRRADAPSFEPAGSLAGVEVLGRARA